MAHRWETVETVSDFIFLGSKITADGDCSHEIKRCLLLGRKDMTNLDIILKSRDILSLSCIFSILVSRLFICDSILISRFWINFTFIIRNSLSGRFPISSSFVWFGGHLPCSFICWLFLCLFILFKLLNLGCPFCILAVCGVLFIVAFPHCVWVCTGGLSRFPG